MLENIESIFQEQCELVPDHPIIVGVSGGPDSLCLMESLRQAGYKVIVAHFNHKLRPDSDLEANALEKTVSRKNLASVFGAADVNAFAEAEGMSTEEAARTLRYRFLFEQAHKLNAQAIAVGHTADDQVETVFMHFLRGAGLAGLKGMTYRSFLPAFDQEIPVIRPLLDIWREETVVYCAAHSLKPYYDPSNDSLNFLRNRIRHLLIPTLESYNPRFREAVYRTSRALAGDYAAISELLDSFWKQSVISENSKLIAFNADRLCIYPPAIQRHLVRRALEKFNAEDLDIRFSVLDRASEFLAQNHYGRVDLTGNLRLFREADRVYVAGDEAGLPFELWPQMPQGVEVLSFDVPGQLDLSGGWYVSCEQWRIPALALEQALNSDDPFQVWLDANKLPDTLEIRNRRPGDRFEPIGMEGHSMKLSDFFINVKLPRRARDGWPLLCSGEQVIWVPGYHPSHPYRLTDKTRRVLYFTVAKREE